MTGLLVVIADRRIMGEIQRDRRGRLTFVYADSWRFLDAAYPLSLSMPLVVAEHRHARIEPWLWGLFPDNEAILARWGQRFHVSLGNVFALLGAVGEDCPGAVQMVRPERVDEILRDDDPQVEWLTEAEVAERLRILRKDQSAWRVARDTGQFSLSGAQPKTAFLFDGQRWGVPFGPTPTTHILKPPTDGFDGHAENEHLCLTLARALGLSAARSQVRRFEDEVAIVVERYDRVRLDGSIRRLHQEDMCQVLGLPLTKKYQNEGGPECARLSEAIRTHSGEPGDDAWTFARATMLNWIIGGTDAHAKNFSMLIGAGGRARLAPLYDVASMLPYEFDPKRLKMATKIGGKYLLEEVYSRHWVKFAAETRHPPSELLDMGKNHGGDVAGHVRRNRRRCSRRWARSPNSPANGRGVERTLGTLRQRPGGCDKLRVPRAPPRSPRSTSAGRSVGYGRLRSLAPVLPPTPVPQVRSETDPPSEGRSIRPALEISRAVH